MKMGKVFHSDDSGNAQPNDPSIAPGWYFQIDLAAPVGPFSSKSEAQKAARSEVVMFTEENNPDVLNEEPRIEHAVLRFWVPVYVTIEDDRVTDVHIDDAAPASGYHNVQPDPDIIEGDDTDEFRAAAIDVAFNGDLDWPSWEFGW